MGYKEISYEPIGKSGWIVEITRRDSNGQKTDSYKALNQKDYWKILDILKRKYGITPEQPRVSKEERDKEIRKEIEWMES